MIIIRSIAQEREIVYVSNFCDYYLFFSLRHLSVGRLSVVQQLLPVVEIFAQNLQSTLLWSWL